jgi:hypothetical protein
VNEFLEMSGCGVRVKNALERASAKESSEFDGVNAVALVAGGMEAEAVGDQQIRDERANKIEEPVGLSTLLEGDRDRAGESLEEVADVSRIGLEDGLDDEFAVGVENGGRNS